MVAAGAAKADPAQASLAAALDRVIACLAQKRKPAGPLKRLLASRRSPPPCTGLYVHGGVGRGKTMLVDVFFGLAAGVAKRRVHFDAFMQDVHARIARQRKTAGRDPVGPVARALAAEAGLLCVDEFAVNDIADAMLLDRLFTRLFAEGVCLVATSNVAPQDLYRDGLNRQLFLPFLDRLARHAPPFPVGAGEDYRLGAAGGRGAWFAPLSAASNRAFEARWRAAADGHAETPMRLPLRGRELVVPRAAGSSARFAFGQLCGAATGPEDYIALAERFACLFLEGVPMMDHSRRNEAKRFIQLVDCLYDRRVRLVASAESGPQALYGAHAGVERAEFARTVSRLVEMQSEAYGQKSTIAAKA